MRMAAGFILRARPPGTLALGNRLRSARLDMRPQALPSLLRRRSAPTPINEAPAKSRGFCVFGAVTHPDLTEVFCQRNGTARLRLMLDPAALDFGAGEDFLLPRFEQLVFGAAAPALNQTPAGVFRGLRAALARSLVALASHVR